VGDYSNWDQVPDVLACWHWARKPMASTINILSVALYDLFGAVHRSFSGATILPLLQNGVLLNKYFECGGDRIHGPIALLSGIAPSPALLFYHFYKVMFYSIWVMFTHPRPVNNSNGEVKPTLAVPPVWEYPFLLIKSVKVVRDTVVVIMMG
ncbi:squalene epoxidase-domain-containing protein, partial [Boletus edulis BED1]